MEIENKVYCANCKDLADFSPPNDSLWFCSTDCYEEYYELNETINP